MTENGNSLHIELEDVGGTSWWAGVLATLFSQYGNAHMRFVGRVDGEKRYTSAVFPTIGTMPPPPRAAWVPEMTQSLAELRREIEDDGWVVTGHGDQPWELHYQRLDTARSG